MAGLKRGYCSMGTLTKCNLVIISSIVVLYFMDTSAFVFVTLYLSG